MDYSITEKKLNHISFNFFQNMFNFFLIWCFSINIRCFQNLGNMSNAGMMGNPAERFITDHAIADIGMSVLGCSTDVSGVIQMNDMQTGKTDDTIKFIQYSIKVRKIISCIMNMTCIQTDTISI